MAEETDAPSDPERGHPARSGRLAHHIEPQALGRGAQPTVPVAGAQPATRRPALALTAEGPRRAELIAWATAHADALRTLRLLAPAGIGTLLADHVGLVTDALRSGTVGPAATAGLVAAGEIDGLVAFTDPIELRPGENTTRSLTRLALFWDIPVAGNRATADILLARIIPAPSVTMGTARAAMIAQD